MRRLLLILSIVCAWPAMAVADEPFCELYAVGHFGNWYEVAGVHEMRTYLGEMKYWGFNRYLDWFDTLDCSDPFVNDGQYDLANALWDAKKQHYRSAQKLGMAVGLVITPNVVYRDQLRPEWLAKKGGRVFGQLICPHQAGAREAILRNHENLFEDLSRAGVRLRSLSAAPYDYGGCTCEKCAPWIITFAELTCEIHKIARRYHPGVELHFIGWWWSAQEHAQFAEWMDAHAPGLAASMALHIPYEKTSVADVPLPKGCRRHAFVHIGYADQAAPRDVYGRLGPVVAPQRLAKTVADLRGQGVTGVTAYSEGCFDDVNKALLGGLWTKQYGKANEALRAYAKRYFDADEEQADAWASWLEGWGRPFELEAGNALAMLPQLSGQRSSGPHPWRRRQWELKSALLAMNREIIAAAAWDASRLGKVEQFWRIYEMLQREVYGTGPLRHIMGPDYIDLPWIKSWRELTKRSATKPASDEQ